VLRISKTFPPFSEEKFALQTPVDILANYLKTFSCKSEQLIVGRKIALLISIIFLLGACSKFTGTQNSSLSSSEETSKNGSVITPPPGAPPLGSSFAIGRKAIQLLPYGLRMSKLKTI